MNVYTVEDWVTLDARPLAIFSTQEKAEAFVAACAADGADDMLVREWELDKLPEPEAVSGPVAMPGDILDLDFRGRRHEPVPVHAREPFDV